jgi:hypothetical protein
MSRDARAPIIPIGVEESETHALLMANGEVRSAFNITLSEHDAGRIRAGYCCVRCYEAQDDPFPEKCWVCGFPMKEKQLEFFGKAYQGTQHMGPETSLEDELAMLEEAEEIARRQEWGISVPTISVPRSI